MKIHLTKLQIQEALACYVLRKRPRNNKGTWLVDVELIGSRDMSEVMGATVTLTRNQAKEQTHEDHNENRRSEVSLRTRYPDRGLRGN